jgi:hypothetical protein
VNAALLLLGTAYAAGADVPPPPGAPPAQPPPAVAPAPGCCDGPSVGAFGWGYGCGCDDCGGRATLHDRLRARFAGRRHHGGADCCDPCAAPAPVYAPAPVFHGSAVAACPDPCQDSKHGLFSRFRGRLGGHRNKGGDCCDPCWGAGGFAGGPWVGYPGGCATPLPPGAAPVAPPPPGAAGEPPKEMPKPKDTTPPKSNGSGPAAQVAPPTPVTPVSGPRLTGTSSPY